MKIILGIYLEIEKNIANEISDTQEAISRNIIFSFYLIARFPDKIFAI